MPANNVTNAPQTYLERVIEQIELLDSELEKTELISPIILPANPQVKEINICLNDINNTFRILSRSTANDIFTCYKQCKEEKLKQNATSDIQQTRQIVTKLKEINPHFARLLKIKNILPNQLKELAAKEHPNDLETQKQHETIYRFAHLNAAQLSVFSDVVITLRNYIKNNSETVEKSLIKPVIDTLDEIYYDIIESMKMRLESEKPAKNGVGIDSSMLKSMVEVQQVSDALEDHKIDPTYDGKVPHLPFSKTENNYTSIPDYFFYYIGCSNIENAAWAEKWAKKNNHFIPKTWSDVILLPVKNYFDPKTNPYVGIIADGVNLITDNYIKPTIEFVEESINAMRGNWVAKEINDLIDRIEHNENFQKIQEDLAKKKNNIIEKARLIQNYLSTLGKNHELNPVENKEYTEALEQFEIITNDINKLEEGWIYLTADINWDNLQKSLEKLSQQIDNIQVIFDEKEWNLLIEKTILVKANELFTHALDISIKNDFIKCAKEIKNTLPKHHDLNEHINNIADNAQQKAILNAINQVGDNIYHHALEGNFDADEAEGIKQQFVNATFKQFSCFSKNNCVTEIIAQSKLDFIVSRKIESFKEFTKLLFSNKKINQLISLNFEAAAKENIKKLDNWMIDDSKWAAQIYTAKNFSVDINYLDNLLQKELKRLQESQKKFSYFIFNTQKTEAKITALTNAITNIKDKNSDNLKKFAHELLLDKALIQKRGKFSLPWSKSRVQTKLEKFVSNAYPEARK